MMNSANPVGWFDIHVANLERAKAFYETVFAIELTDLPSEWGKQSTFPYQHGGANATGALVEKSSFVTNESTTVVYFVSEDCLTEEGRVKEAGGEVIRPKSSIGEFGFISLLKDTEGNTIGLHSMK